MCHTNQVGIINRKQIRVLTIMSIRNPGSIQFGVGQTFTCIFIVHSHYLSSLDYWQTELLKFQISESRLQVYSIGISDRKSLEMSDLADAH